MKKYGIPCNEYTEIGPKGQDKITFTFVGGGDGIPSSCTVSLGDTDPMTGEKITDVSFFREYHSLRNRQIYHNKREVSVPLSSRQKEMLREERDRIAREFVESYGYEPTPDTLNYLLREKCPKEYRMEIDSFVSEDGVPWSDCLAELSDPAAEQAFREMEDALDGELDSLDRFGETLTSPLQRDVFRMLRRQADGINVRGMAKKLAEQYGVDKSDISYMKKQIGKKLVRWMKERAEEEDE